MTPRVASFRLEYAAGFKSECMADFVGIHNLRPSQRAQVRAGLTIRVPVFRFPALMSAGGELYVGDAREGAI
ncbi:hypothetical protein CIT26_17790 [Mesorhizobium temperatum]|uniref:Uncharacterized protein n=1 Tax=Mesorhizobium temperatum TaxID=241416 RepID=A0A271LLR7_9HYPH|nr:hypothetical protein CIT26_17790 [Mesorhizobium temperatum]